MTNSDEEYQAFNTSVPDSGLPDTFPLVVNEIKIGGYAIIKNFPCKIYDTHKSKMGKHEHAKVTVVGIDIFSDKKYEESFPGGTPVLSFVPKRNNYQVANIDGKQLSLINDDGDIRDDLDLPTSEELSAMIVKSFNDGETVTVSVLSAVGKERIVECKKD